MWSNIVMYFIGLVGHVTGQKVMTGSDVRDSVIKQFQHSTSTNTFRLSEY